MSLINRYDTIAAIATPPGKGGVAIIRISGTLASEIFSKVLLKLPVDRGIVCGSFYSSSGKKIDTGLGLFFKGPRSFTGEDVAELQGHGGPVVSGLLLQAVLECGARLAQPGEFSERAFLNGKMDLAQAEAVCDLINANSKKAAFSALCALQGDFSQKIHSILEKLTYSRVRVESQIDFSEDAIDLYDIEALCQDMDSLSETISQLIRSAQKGVVLREGLRVVIVGKPNVGKSSLLNQLSEKEAAIVTEEPGTTRDLLTEAIQIEGRAFYIVDTAGIRETENKIEQEGVRRAYTALETAHIILSVHSVEDQESLTIEFPEAVPVIAVQNKIDLTGESPAFIRPKGDFPTIKLSSKTGAGLDLLKQYLVEEFLEHNTEEDTFTARQRHVEALRCACTELQEAKKMLLFQGSWELCAEYLRQSQEQLALITGAFTPEDLLGEIFSTFCIGK